MTLPLSIPFIISLLCALLNTLCCSYSWLLIFLSPLLFQSHFHLPISNWGAVSKEEEEGDRRWGVFIRADSPQIFFFIHCLFLDGFHPRLHPSICLPCYYEHQSFSSSTFHWSPLLWLGFVFGSSSCNKAIFSWRKRHVPNMQHCWREPIQHRTFWNAIKQICSHLSSL